MHMAGARLFVKSVQTEVPDKPIYISGLGAGPQLVSGKSKLTTLSQQDAQAKDLLKKSGIPFELIDISKGFRTRIGAKRSGVAETPTLLDRESVSKRYVGLKAISQYVAEKQPTT